MLCWIGAVRCGTRYLFGVVPAFGLRSTWGYCDRVSGLQLVHALKHAVRRRYVVVREIHPQRYRMDRTRGAQGQQCAHFTGEEEAPIVFAPEQGLYTEAVAS